MRHIDLSLSSIVKSVLNEDMVTTKRPRPVGNHYSSVLDRLRDAIKFRRFMTIYYDDKKGDKGTVKNPDNRPKWGNPRKIRSIIPYALYFSNQNGELTLRAYHYSKTNTKRGPEKWKEFIVGNMKNVTISPREFTESDLPDNRNKTGDKHASHLVAIVDFNSNPYEPKEEFMSPIERERERMRRQKKGESYEDLYTNQPNHQGAIDTAKSSAPEVKKGRNLKTMQNLGKPGNVDYKKAWQDVQQANGRNTFRDWDAAEAERRDQQSQQNRPMIPPQNSPGPVNTMQQQPQNINNNEEEENWDEYLNRPNNNNF